MKLTLYTCDSGKWLHENGDSFKAWNEEKQEEYSEQAKKFDSDEEYYSFEVDKGEYFADRDYTVLANAKITFKPVAV